MNNRASLTLDTQTKLPSVKLPSVNYVLKISKDYQDWAGKIVTGLHHPIQLSTISCTTKAYHGRIYVPTNLERKLKRILIKLLQSKDISEYEIEGKTRNLLSVYVVARDPRVCYAIQQNKFELLSPVIVNEDSETYEIRAFSESKSNKYITKLQSTLADSKIHIEQLVKRLSVPDASWDVPLVRFDEKEIQVIDLLVKGNYFDEKKRGVTQKDIAKKLHISVGKVNEIIRNIELIGFKNLLSVHPDLNEFNVILNALVDYDKLK